ncbi:MAG: glycosyltransferase [Ignavibacteriae bacterium]|nr:glycosyltransferase [Ignavibacteria bacterium]MBI3364613.1 glycosyltransferase [Ignavibacteriota bacterium]
MKVNWFSPLPPAKTGIADYTARLLPVLSKHAEVILWTDQETWDPVLEEYATVKRLRSDSVPWRDVNAAAVTIYHIGNNRPFHGSIFEVSRKHPGIMVLHDVSLHIFVEHMFRLQWNNLDEYYCQMFEYYGDKGLRDAIMFSTIPNGVSFEHMSYQYPLTEFVLGNSTAAVVHTKSAFDLLQKKKKWPCTYIPLPYPGEEVETKFGKQKWTILPSQKCKLVIFGFIGYNRRLDAVLDTLGAFPRKDAFHLDMYGEIEDEHAVRNKIERLNLSKTVTFHGYASEADLNAALSQAHLAINLRYPTMGEASISQLKIWSHKLPSLVTPVGWYAHIPEGAAAFVRHDHEVEDIIRHLSAFLENPDSFRKMGEKGFEVLRIQHSPELYATTLLDFARKHASAGVERVLTDYLVDRASAELKSFADESVTDASIINVAKSIHSITAKIDF